MSSSGLPAFLATSWRQVSTNVSREMTALKSYAALENAESRNGARLHVRVGRAAFQRDGVDHTAVDIFKQLSRLDFLPALAAERRGKKAASQSARR